MKVKQVVELEILGETRSWGNGEINVSNCHRDDYNWLKSINELVKQVVEAEFLG